MYLTAFAIDEGESVIENSLTGGEGTTLPEALRFDDDLIAVDPDRAIEFFYHDCPPSIASSAAAELRPMSMAAMSGAADAAAWRVKPSTYVVCTDDRAIPVALQRSSAARVGDVVEMPTSHSPFLSQPQLVGELLVELARSDRSD